MIRNTLNKIEKIIFSIAILSSTYFISCKKTVSSNCYDKTYHESHKNDFCTQDCPGVTGCDGKFYCNECMMHTNGIKTTK